ncbi:MAG TPA: neuroendocrine convertase 1, partial [Vicinamibacteria bacterium]
MPVNRGAVLCLLLALPAVVAEAQDRLAPQALRQMQALLAEKASRTPVQRRIDSQLLAAHRVRRGLPVARGITTLPGLTEWMSLKLLPGDVVRVDIRATVTAALLEDLRRQGATVESAYPEYDAIRAGISLARVERIAALDGVRFVEPAHEAVTNVGAVTSQGDAAHRAPQARALGLTGAGIKVGVLSDGVASLATSQATGDLPTGANMTVLPGQAGSGNEGTAMLEIVHDLAPGAPLSFATAFGGVASFAANIRALRDAGCQVIVDDVTYFNEGAFQDGPIAQAVNDVTATGVLYFSSAANSGNFTSGTSGTWE